MTDLGVDWSSRPGDLVVGNGKVFVSNGDRIIVANTDGELVDEITGLSDAYGLAMAPDGAHLYAALIGPKQVLEIDTATLAITRRIDLDAYPCPTNLAQSGDWLWVGYGCLLTYGGGVLGLDLSEQEPEPIAVASDFHDAPLVAAGGSTLAVGETGSSPSDLFVYDVSGTPTLRGEIDGHTYDTSSPVELVVTPDGSNVLSASAFPHHFERWDATSLTRVRSYGEESASVRFPRAVAISPDGVHIVGGHGDGTDITLYEATTGTKIYTEDNEVGGVVAGSVAFSGTDVFAVLRSSYDRLHLWRIEDIAFPASTLTLTAPSDPVTNQPLTLIGRLELPGGVTPGAQPLTVTRRLSDGSSETLDGVTTAADGTFTVTDIPTVGGEFTYAVLWDGNGNFRWSRASATATVKYSVSLTLTGPASGSVRTWLAFSGVFQADGLNPANVRLVVQRTVTNGNDTLATTLPIVSPRDDGSYGFVDRPVEGGEYTYTVEWVGNDMYAPAETSHEVRVQGLNG
ncbi:WD40 repeat domain-containing protein [Streptosporangium sp. NPDC006013]|uniref:WD40 repeat domain-containing protein n=1 Tax=Streptosporangium sp. NPDC006013 TaxID=3155596 RepID=UPI0033A7CB52